jgi:hypothetical protein
MHGTRRGRKGAVELDRDRTWRETATVHSDSLGRFIVLGQNKRRIPARYKPLPEKKREWGEGKYSYRKA